MTKAMRWGVSSMMIVGGIALGAFAGCSDDEEPKKVEETPDTGPFDTGVDTGVIDSVAPDSAPVDTGADAPTPPAADRQVTLFFGAPDLPGKFVCLGAFGPTTDLATAEAPASFQPAAGAMGVPAVLMTDAGPTADPDMTKSTAFNYGAVVPVPLSPDAIAALKVFKVVLYLLDANPAATGSTCGAEWKNVRSDPKKWKSFEPGAVAKGEHALLSMIGCVGGPDATGTCGTAGNNFEVRLDKIDVAKPAAAGSKLGIQLLNLSQFPGAGPAPSFAGGADIYLATKPAAPSADAGADADETADAAPAAPTFIKLASNIKYKEIAAASVGVDLPAGANKDNSYIIVSAPGATPCMSSAPGVGGCLSWTLPLAPFLGPTGYPRVGGGLFPNTNQVIALVGSPVPPVVDGGAGTPSLRLAFARAATWP